MNCSRAADGWLSESKQSATAGRGSGGTTDPLGSQGSLTFSHDHSLLFAVNAGTGDISVFRVKGANLALVKVVSSETRKCLASSGSRCPPEHV